MKYQTLDDFTEEYLRTHPEEMDDYITELFEEYAQDGGSVTLLTTLRILCRIKGVTDVAEVSGLSRKGVQKATSPEGNPSFETMNAILKALGYRLIPQKL
jgi:probable addiction module antidote protein